MNRNNIISEIKILNQKRLDKRRKSSDRVLFTIQMENLISKYNIKPFEINNSIIYIDFKTACEMRSKYAYPSNMDSKRPKEYI